MATAEGVMDASSVLATFRSVSGDTFIRAIKAAQDLSAEADKVLVQPDADARLEGVAIHHPDDASPVGAPSRTSAAPAGQASSTARTAIPIPLSMAECRNRPGAAGCSQHSVAPSARHRAGTSPS
ncbi:MAG: hypothetical protein H7841_04820 [Magnetospirillum sp. WYHS-4]